MKLLFAFTLLISSFGWAEGAIQSDVRLAGVVKKLDGDAVVLRIRDRNIRLSRRFFEDRDNLTVGEVGRARYTMTFKGFGSRKPSSKR